SSGPSFGCVGSVRECQDLDTDTAQQVRNRALQPAPEVSKNRPSFMLTKILTGVCEDLSLSWKTASGDTLAPSALWKALADAMEDMSDASSDVTDASLDVTDGTSDMTDGTQDASDAPSVMTDGTLVVTDAT